MTIFPLESIAICRRARQGRARRGAAALELAFVLPVLLLLGIGSLDYGRGVSTCIALSNATRSGADWAATHQFTDATRAPWEAQVRNETTTELQSTPGFNASLLEIDIDPVIESDSTVRVTVSTTYTYQSAIDWPGLPAQYTLRRSVAVRQYR